MSRPERVIVSSLACLQGYGWLDDDSSVDAAAGGNRPYEFQGRTSKPMPRDITMNQLRIVTAVCAFSLSMAQVYAEDQFLVVDGKANAEIIISESPARSTRLAAHELQTYVAKMSGAQLPIETKPSADVAVQIYVGESPHAAKLGVTADRLEHGAYRITSGEKWLALIGDDTDFTPREPWA